MNFDLFCNFSEKKIKTAITFAYDIEKMRIIYQKNREKKGARFHQGLPGELFSDPPIAKRKKSYFKKKIFSINSKKFKKLPLWAKRREPLQELVRSWFWMFLGPNLTQPNKKVHRTTPFDSVQRGYKRILTFFQRV